MSRHNRSGSGFLVRSLLFGGCFFLFLSGCGQPDRYPFRGEGGRASDAKAITPPLALRWDLELQPLQEEHTKAFSSFLVMGDVVYFGSPDGNFYAFDLESGYIKWYFTTGFSINSVPASDGQSVFFGSEDGWAYALSAEDGQLLWKFETGKRNNSSFVLFDYSGLGQVDTVVFVGDSGEVHFLATKDGAERFRLPNQYWSHMTFQVTDSGEVFFLPGPPEAGRSIFGAYHLRDRRFLWLFSNRSHSWFSFPALDRERLYFSSSTFQELESPTALTFYALDRATGQEVWRQSDRVFLDIDPGSFASYQVKNFNNLDFMAPAIKGNRIVFTAADKVARCFDSQTGETVWRQTFAVPTSSAPIIAGDRLYFGLRGDDFSPEERAPSLVCLSLRDGSVQWEMETSGILLSSPTVSGNRIIFGTETNRLYVLEEVF